MVEPKTNEDDPTLGQLGLGPIGPPSLAERIGEGLDRLETLRDRPAAAVVGGLCVVAALALWLALRPAGPTVPVEDVIPQVTLTPTSAAVAEQIDVVVHVSGAVERPGVYTLPPTARVVDAVAAAGGSGDDADLHQLNLAALVMDGQRIHVPVPGETLSVPVDSGATVSAGPLDLNRADVVMLQTLPGVGPATAEAIVRFRDDNGPFRTVDDLLDVPGIGPAKLAALADLVVVR